MKRSKRKPSSKRARAKQKGKRRPGRRKTHRQFKGKTPRPVRRRRHKTSRKRMSDRPRDCCWSCRKWAAQAKKKAGVSPDYRELHDGTMTIHTEGKTLNEPVHKEFRAGVTHSRPGFVVKMRRGRVWGKNGTVLTPDNRLLGEVSWEFDDRLVRGHQHPVFHRWKSHPLSTFQGTAAVLAFVFSANYFHWMFDVLPRIQLIRQSGFQVDKYIVNDDGLAFQDDTLNMLGIPREMRIVTDSNCHVQARRLVVPAIPMQLGYPQWTCDFIREQILKSADVQSPGDDERIYVSRTDSSRRRIVNEEEVRACVTANGFKIVVLDSLPVSEQIRTFAGAKVIVAAHGAGLANLVFCNPGTKVMELFSPIYIRKFYWNLSSQTNLDYYYMVGENHHVASENTWEGAADFLVDTGKLSRLLQIAGVS